MLLPVASPTTSKWVNAASKWCNYNLRARVYPSINEDRKRASLFSNLRSHNADVFLLSETGRPFPERVAQWTQECQDLSSPLFSLLSTILPYYGRATPWSLLLIPSRLPTLSFMLLSLSPDRVTDATFLVGDSKVRVVSIYRSLTYLPRY
ncbi:BQ5605_C017g08422 [Microbotryum silenes-dioicae]|uniref:BQ5605_C017g08422 protein n=1 Tax=Microbotryum silenes-dioicae TaxID=796604 RepID=A0A2X0NY84_9BASI|nr:BQ5605_C017g08422 [Microbotryum silenes-dioicae]